MTRASAFALILVKVLLATAGHFAFCSLPVSGLPANLVGG